MIWILIRMISIVIIGPVVMKNALIINSVKGVNSLKQSGINGLAAFLNEFNRVEGGQCLIRAAGKRCCR